MTEENGQQSDTGFAAVVPPLPEQSPGEQRAAELIAGNEAQAAAEAHEQEMQAAHEPDPGPVDATEATPERPHVAIDGDATGGWIAQVHTGEMAHVFTCVAESLEAAKAEIMRLYAEVTKGGDGASSAA